MKIFVQVLMLINCYFYAYTMNEASKSENVYTTKDLVESIIQEKLLKYENIPSKRCICKLFDEKVHQNISHFTNIAVPSTFNNPAQLSDLHEELLYHIFTEKIEHIFSKSLFFDKAVKKSLKFIHSVILLNKQFYQFRFTLMQYLKKLVIKRFVAKKLFSACKKADMQLIRNLFYLRLETNKLYANLFDINARTKHGFTPLMLAVMNNHNDIVEMLLKNNSDIDAQDNGGCTALMHAVRLGHKIIVKKLLAYYPNLGLKSKDGYTALYFSKEKGQSKITKLLEIESSDEEDIDQEDISVTLKILSGTECRDYFGVDITSKGYLALEFNFENSCADTFILRPSYLNLPFIKPKKIAKSFHYATSAYVGTLSTISLVFFWPGVFGAAAMGSYMADCNADLDKFISKNGLHVNEVVQIAPYESKVKIVFVRREQLRRLLVLKLFNKTQKKLVVFNYRIS